MVLVISILFALLALVGFERLADEMLEGETVQFDQAVRGFVHGFSSPGLTHLMQALSFIGSMASVAVVATVICVLLWRYNHRNGAVLLATATFGGTLLMGVMKLAFHRQRPEPYFGIPVPITYSFPSGHALVAFCFYAALASILTTEHEHTGKRIAIWIGAVAMVTGIGLSRIYLGVHYPSDVLAGYLAGLFWVMGISIAHQRLHRAGKDAIQTLYKDPGVLDR